MQKIIIQKIIRQMCSLFCVLLCRILDSLSEKHMRCGIGIFAEFILMDVCALNSMRYQTSAPLLAFARSAIVCGFFFIFVHRHTDAQKYCQQGGLETSAAKPRAWQSTAEQKEVRTFPQSPQLRKYDRGEKRK